MAETIQAHKDDVGTLITFDCGEDVSGAVAVKLLFTLPDGSTVAVDGVAAGNTITYTTTAIDGVLAQEGLVRFQGWADLGGWQGCSTEDVFLVGPQLADPS